MDAASKVGKKRQKTGGRQKGVPNKVTGELKAAILTALDRAGGVDYLEGLAGSHPPVFAQLLGKVLPLQVTGENGGAVKFEVAAPWLKQSIQTRNSA